MRTTSKIKKSLYSKSNTSTPFFRKRGDGSFFSASNQVKSPFFNPVAIQTKLAIGQSGDPYEQEADRIAAQVVNNSVQRKSIASQITPLSYSKHPVQGKLFRKQGYASNKLESQIGSSKGGGGSMDQSTKSEMSQKFGMDFSGVRIHTGRQSIQMNQELGAKAFTVGNDIHFNQGQYNPTDHEGKRLLAHELTHVVQQNNLHHHIQRTPDHGGTASMHEELTRKYSQETGVPYREGLQYTEGYRQWLTGQHDDSEARQTPPVDDNPPSSDQVHEVKKQKKKVKKAINIGTGVKADKKGVSGAVNAEGSLKVPLGSPWGEHWKLALKTGLFLKWQQALSGPAKEKLDAGMKLQFDFLDLLIKSKNFSLTSGLYLAGSGGFKSEDEKTKPFGSMQTGLTTKFTYTGNIWEANVFITGGFSMFDAKGKPLVPGGFLYTGGSIYLRGNIGDEQHKVLLGPTLGVGYNLDSSQGKSEGVVSLGVRLML